MAEFDYKQRPWSRVVSQAEWDSIFGVPKLQAKPGPQGSGSRQLDPDDTGRETFRHLYADEIANRFSCSPDEIDFSRAVNG